MRWLEVSLTASAEAAEAVADVLARFASAGTAITGEAQTAGAPLTVRAYLPEPAASAYVQQQVREAIWHLSQISPLPEPAFQWIDGEDWAESWKDHFHPVAVGRRLIIVPAWMQANDPVRRPLFLEPGMAFGTGAHPSTRLCLAALEDLIQPEDVVVDVGCGSGILSVAAVLYGAGHVLACDLDEQAIAATLRSAELNGVASRLEVFQGSLPEAAARLAGRRPADVLAANILAPVLSHLLAGGLARLVRPGGSLVLSGILLDQRHIVDQPAIAAGLNFEAESCEGDWLALTYRRGASSRPGAAQGLLLPVEKETPPR